MRTAEPKSDSLSAGQALLADGKEHKKLVVIGRQAPGKAVSIFQATEGGTMCHKMVFHTPGVRGPHPRGDEVLACPICPKCKLHGDIGTGVKGSPQR